MIHGGTDEADDLLLRVGQTLAKNAMRDNEERQRRVGVQNKVILFL